MNIESYFNFIISIYIKNFSYYYIYFYLTIIFIFIIIKLSPYIKLIDTPNKRSSHKAPTPLGGGLPILLIILIGNINAVNICPEFFIGSILLAIVSLWDDIKPLKVAPRLIIQMLVVGLMIILLPVNNKIIGIPISIIKIVLFFSGVWFINIYNFMDGIDGLAGGYANAAALGFIFCIKDTLVVEAWNLNVYNQLFYITLAFLIFNWSPAKIFMGDVGSTFLGFTFFSLGLRGLIFGNYIIYGFISIMSFFWIDATITLTRRYLRGCKVFSAHREHAFHKAADIFGHWKVSCFIILFTIFWLNPMAKISILNADSAPLYTIITIIPVLLIVLVFKPGFPTDHQNHLLISLINRFKK